MSEDGYRDPNPLLKDIKMLEARVKREEANAEYWHKGYNEVTERERTRDAEWETKLKHFPTAMARFFLWCVAVPTWFLVGIAAIVAPPWLVTQRGYDVGVLRVWWLGLVVQGGLVVFLYVNSKKGERS